MGRPPADAEGVRMDRLLTKYEVAAMWFYHDEYADSKLSAVDFYKQLSDSQKRLMKDMVGEIMKAHP